MLNQQRTSAGEQALRVVDKQLQNFQHLGFIELLFPNARVIHCSRDPLDTCLSCYFQDFGDVVNQAYSYSIEDLGHYYRQYERYMTHWKSVCSLPILDVSYEEMVADQEAQTRRIIEFLGLDWDDQCLRFYELDPTVLTLSYDQVRQPMYASSSGRWKYYEKHIGPMRDALGLLGG